MSHTPGPWKLSSASDRYVIAERGGLIAEAVNGYAANGEGARANAGLIAAAPELLEALKWHLRTADEGGLPSTKAVTAARAAIAKAEGRT